MLVYELGQYAVARTTREGVIRRMCWVHRARSALIGSLGQSGSLREILKSPVVK